MDDLAEAVHAGVGAARDRRVQRRLREFRERALERVLNRLAVGLRLPAAERRAVVLNAECDSHHDRSASFASITRASSRVSA